MNRQNPLSYGPDSPDEKLVKVWQSGDEGAFTILYERHKEPVFRFIYRQLSCKVDRKTEADDLFSEVWVKVVKAIPSYRPDAKFTTWLYTIARNAVIDVHRKESRKKGWLGNFISKKDNESEEILDADDYASQNPNPEELVAGREMEKAIDEIMESLPPEQKEVFIMRQQQGLPFAEIAKITGMKEPTVKSRMRYALTTLADNLEERGLLPERG